MFNLLPKFVKRWRGAIITIILASLLIIILRLSGILQLLELKALDFFFVNRPIESPDERIVLVTLLEKDIQSLQQYPLSDLVLATLLEKIKNQNPRVIGLDIFRDFPVPSRGKNQAENQQAYSNLLEIFRSTPNLIGIAKITSSPAYPSVNPPTVLEQLGQVSAADLVVDNDGIVRRGNLFPIADGSAKSSIPSLGLSVALNYLVTEGIEPMPTEKGWLKLKNTVFLPFQANSGGYIRTNDNGYQVLLNWRSCQAHFSQVSVSQVLKDEIPKDLFQNRIVLVGNNAISVKDIFLTPCSQGTGSTPATMSGVEIQAHLASQIISAVLDGRPLLQVWSDSKEYSWIVGSIVTVAVWGWKQRKLDNAFKISIKVLTFTAVEAIILIGSSYLLFLLGWWIPLIPTLLGLGVAALMIIACIYITQLQEAKNNLEAKVASRTEELEQTLEQLRQSQQQLIIKEKQASLGTLTASIAHQIKNPLSLINVNISSSLSSLQQVEENLEENSLFFADVIQDIFPDKEQILSAFKENLTNSQEQVFRVNNIIQDILGYFRQEQSNPSLTDLNNLIGQVLQGFERQDRLSTQELLITIETNYDTSIAPIEIISKEIEKALVNLIENAYYTVHSKQKKIGLNYIPTITIKTRNLGDKVEIRIRDNGEGIPKDLLDKIFEPFWTNKPALEGTGLGLFFVYQIIVEIHKGEIRVDSVVGEYSEFILTLLTGSYP